MVRYGKYESYRTVHYITVSNTVSGKLVQNSVIRYSKNLDFWQEPCPKNVSDNWSFTPFRHSFLICRQLCTRGGARHMGPNVLLHQRAPI